jgi:cytochrome c5
MKRILLSLFIGSYLLIAGSMALAYQGQQSSKPATVTHTQTPATRTGEQVFNDNCSRCHMPPMAIPPRITGTIVMHMRTRARLSRKDEELLLKYLAP